MFRARRATHVVDRNAIIRLHHSPCTSVTVGTVAADALRLLPAARLLESTPPSSAQYIAPKIRCPRTPMTLGTLPGSYSTHSDAMPNQAMLLNEPASQLAANRVIKVQYGDHD